MKCTIPEISWHNREPVLSVDIFPETGDFYRLASGGGDSHVLIWQLHIAENGAVNQEVISDLTRHQRAVNCVRWSPSGKYLASCDDDANIIIWHLKTDNIPLLEGDTADKETWLVYKILRGHKEDVYDICWSIDESKILSGSVDNTAILWDTNKGKMDHILSDHKGFVQGVAWDPKNRVISTISTDRVCRIFDPLGKQVKARIQRGKITSVPDSHFLKDKDAKYFHDDTFKSFFRRLQFSPDGSLLIVPSGHLETENCKNNINATLVFTLDDFYCPSIILPIPKQSSTVVRCCPILYELREQGPDPIVKLPYRMVFAVGTDHDIILYDTQQTLPFARFQDIHYTRLTDLTWSQDGLLLIASSTDGFCSLITFELDELGVPWIKPESEPEENPLDVSGCEELADKDENVDTTNKIVKKEEVAAAKEEPKKRPSFLVQWALNTPKKRKLEEENKVSESTTGKDIEVIEILDCTEEKEESEDKLDGDGEVAVVKTPRKIKPIRVEDVTVSPKITSTRIEAVSQQNQKINVLTPKRVSKAENTSQQNQIVNVLTPRRIAPITLEPRASPKTESNLNLDQTKKHQHQAENTQNQTVTAPKEKINILVPKRAKPIIVDAKPGTSKDYHNTDNWAGEEDLTSKNEEEDESSDSGEELDPEERQDYQKASVTIQEFFCRKPEQAQKRKSEVAIDAKPKTGAKPIAVRRKPNESEKDNQSLTTNGNEKRPIENKCKNDVICSEDTSVTPKKSKQLKSIQKQTKASPNIQKEEGPPKIKVNSLIKQKNNTPKKNSSNTLLNFLQKSSEKKTKTKSQEPFIKPVDLCVLEDGATDAWVNKTEGKTISTAHQTNEIMIIEDEKTEDFCLQLEDSQGPDEIVESLPEKSNQVPEKSNQEQPPTKLTPKAHRRVPLKTLASPSSKAKKKL